jgi:hypothetical protein
MSTKKRRQSSSSSVFDAIQVLDSQDAVRANRKRTMSTTTTTTTTQKSKAARSQTKIHGHLMECRILLQRAMTTATAADVATTTNSNSNSMVDGCNQLLAQLLQARSCLLTSSSSSSSSSHKTNTANSDDSSILAVDYTQVVTSDTLLSKVLQQEYEQYRHDWKEVLNRRHKDLKLHAGLTAKAQFQVMDSSFWQQVDATVSHEQQVFRQEHQRTNSTAAAAAEVVFDDTKVYQHMLQDFLSSTNTNGAATEEAAAAAQRLLRRRHATKQKKSVDRRASKGRKIRFVEIPKLVNFTFPMARPLVPASSSSSAGRMDEDEWFQSLFGGAAKRKNNTQGQLLKP